MPVRKIPKNYRNLTGIAASKKSEAGFFESTLERDFLSLLEFDSDVLSFDVQPVKVDFQNAEGKSRSYTPDVLVEYRHGSSIFPSVDNILFEVKYRNDIKQNWDILKPKFKAAIRHANQNGMRFKVVTEKEIRTPYLENIRFLLPYMHLEQDEQYSELLVETLQKLSNCSIEELVRSVFFDKWKQAELITVLWTLIATRQIRTDLSIPLTMSATVWVEA
ncbi:heteromeric transposase endonuclease subunit TnsA [Marinomonas piezotolerans]|uniref:Heteromeric transposase endonuclease subunit TnsA n=1 Tax=Marinomonas piezotolerans TaxID=2213058 RepID=A0A370U8P1_9GAMM|nr:TnsA endonuclease N-terminal domain-containing protein [Marinomonas piezotolerans]RDL44137.1 heteromeric transposase endonuclease subunit TnsA [Marinomonas piezotolerans]